MEFSPYNSCITYTIVSVEGLLVEVLVTFLQVEEHLLSTFSGWCTTDPVTDASQKLLEEGL